MSDTSDTSVPDLKADGASLLAPITLIISTLTAIGTSATGLVGKTYRNESGFIDIAFAMSILAALFSTFALVLQRLAKIHDDQRSLLASWSAIASGVGLVLLVLAVVAASAAFIKTTSLSDRPNIHVTVVPESGVSAVRDVNAKATSTGGQSNDQLLMVVLGIKRAPDSSGTQQGRQLYYAKTGPDGNGDLEQEFSVPVDTQTYSELRVYAAVLKERDKAPVVNCDGLAVAENDVANDAAVAAVAHDDRVPAVVGCTTIKFD